MQHLNLINGLIAFTVAFIVGVMNAFAGGGTLLTFPTLIWLGLNSITANATSSPVSTARVREPCAPADPLPLHYPLPLIVASVPPRSNGFLDPVARIIIPKAHSYQPALALAAGR